MADPKDVAKNEYEALMNGEVRVISGLTNKVQTRLNNITPDSLVAAGMRTMLEEKKLPCRRWFGPTTPATKAFPSWRKGFFCDYRTCAKMPATSPSGAAHR